MYIHLFFALIFCSMTACQGELPELARANEQFTQGAKLEALQMYEDIIKRYPDHPSSKEAKVQLEKMYYDSAMKMASSNPFSSYRIIEQQLRLFPDGVLAKKAESFKSRIQDEAFAYQKREKIAQDFCNKAREQQQVLLWREYKKEYPKGACEREAEDALRDIEKNLCVQAREKDPTLWAQYLKDFPQGSCVAEAKEKSIRVDMTVEQLQNLQVRMKECTRLSDKCSRLHERFSELVRKKETDYLRGSYYAYLNNWLSAYDDASKSTSKILEEYRKQGFDTADVQKDVQKICVDACANNQADLRDLKSCVISFDQQSAERWGEYIRDFPNGACASIAQP